MSGELPITVGVAAFERPTCLARCLTSIRRRYPEIAVVVADDSAKPQAELAASDKHLRFLALPFDVGIGVKRNLIAGACETAYLYMTEDDTIFTEATDLRGLLAELRRTRVDLLATGVTLPNGRRDPLEGRFIWLDEGRHLHVQGAPGAVTCDYADNAFLVRAELARALRWDDQQKVVEHLDWYLRLRRAELQVGSSQKVTLEHRHEAGGRYAPYRHWRAHEFQQRLLDVWGLQKVTGMVHMAKEAA